MSSLPTRSQPLRFLLYLEWVLLAIAAIAELPTGPWLDGPRQPGLNLLCLAIFALLGWRLPQRLSRKIGVTGVEFGLIGLMAWVGNVRLIAFLYLVLVLRNSLMFSPARSQSPERWFQWGIPAIAIGLFLWTQAMRFQSRLSSPFSWLNRLPYLAWENRPLSNYASPSELRVQFLLFSFALIFGLVVIFLQLLVGAVLAERQSREQLAVVNGKLRDYAFQMERLATVQERNRIARDIHDSLGHSLTVFNVHLAAALQLLESDPGEAKALILEAKQLGATALREVRESVAVMRADPLQNQSLESAIATLISDFQRSTGVVPDCRIRVERSLPNEIKTALYRIVQEALTNIYKYAAATHVRVQITTEAAAIHLVVIDDGEGFEPGQNTTGFGLQGMQERTLALHGEFELHTAPGQGCHVRVCIPVPE
jgi:signal transduction histidine kinase